jgi:t-SNARE complex subunit (syntaxin)
MEEKKLTKREIVCFIILFGFIIGICALIFGTGGAILGA